MTKKCFVWVGILIASAWVTAGVEAASFRSNWPVEVERVWIGPEYWAGPLQDWRLFQGRLECVVSGGNRTVQLLTHQLGPEKGNLTMSVVAGRMKPIKGAADSGWAGFRIGIKSEVDDYRFNLLNGEGWNAGLTTDGRLFIGDESVSKIGPAKAGGAISTDPVELRLTVEPSGDVYAVTLSAHDPGSGRELSKTTSKALPESALVGSLALVSDYCSDGVPSEQNIGGRGSQRGGDVRFWFSDWQVSGSKLEEHTDRTFGPILWAMHTLSRGVMKMTAQMPPVGIQDSQTVRLQVRPQSESAWKTLDEEPIHTLARTATFRIPDWDSSRDVPYRLVYEFPGSDGKVIEHYWSGTVRKEPVEKEEIVVAGFTGNQDTGFPNASIARNIAYHNPDVLVFTGDQIYESVAGYGIERAPIQTAALDYLRKWYLFGWAFRDVMRDRITVAMPDDHDVYQGNIWGGGGRKVTLENHARGGYVMPAEWVNMVQRTQTSNLPDPYDPDPIEQGIGVYYTDMNYGRVSFAILEDRKFKEGPEGKTPPTGGRPDHVTDPNFDPETFDVPDAPLLGERQLAFIRDWAADWEDADMKVSLTQTILINAATTHGAQMMRLVADLDSNGWPQSGRKRALRELRKGFVFMLGGDQHLPTIIHHGVDAYGDAGYSFCVPSTAAGYPRAFEPEKPGQNRKPGAPYYMGEQKDGLGNLMTVYAVANPQKEQRKPILEKLHDKSSGYGLLRLNKKTGAITIECWKLLVDPAKDGDKGQFEDWPLTVHLEDNYGRKAEGYLPALNVEGMANPVVQVIDESNGEVVYTLRIRGNSYRPKVFKQGQYTIRVGEPGTKNMKTLKGLSSGPVGDSRSLAVSF